MSNKIINVRVEISRGSNVKYEYDDLGNILHVDRILHSPMYYFFNYGFIPNTLSGDGDPVDVVILSHDSFHPTCFIEVKILGMLETIDEKGEDHKIIAIPSEKLDPKSKNINSLKDIDEFDLEKIKFFFENYKSIEKNKWVKIIKYSDLTETLTYLNKCKK